MKLFKWDSIYGQTPPVGFLLREKFGPIWFRIHSSPNSKRYAETENEKVELLARHRKVANEILKEGSVAIFLNFYEPVEEMIELPDCIKTLDLKKSSTYRIADEDGDFYTLYSYRSNLDWPSLVFDQIVLDVAKEKTGPILFVSEETANVYAPYDGGADLLIPNQEQLLNFKSLFIQWTSKRQDGL